VIRFKWSVTITPQTLDHRFRSADGAMCIFTSRPRNLGWHRALYVYQGLEVHCFTLWRHMSILDVCLELKAHGVSSLLIDGIGGVYRRRW
jgi:hypothetical protein